MPNSNCLEGIKCPKCGYEKSFSIEVTKWVDVYDDGTDDSGGDTHWDDANKIQCGECTHEGTVKDFRTEQPTEEA